MRAATFVLLLAVPPWEGPRLPAPSGEPSGGREAFAPGTGLEWRKTDKRAINNLRLSIGTSAPPKAGQKRTLWIDGIVLAKRGIGPMAAGRK